MFNLKISTVGERTTEVEMLNETLANALDKRNIKTNGATVSLNGRILNASDYGKTFSDMGVTDGQQAILSVVVKADSAC